VVRNGTQTGPKRYTLASVCLPAYSRVVELSAGEQTVCRMLSGVPAPLTPGLLAVARRHRVHYLLAAGVWAGASGEPAAALQRELRQAAAFDAWDEQDLTQLLDALAAAGIDALLMKGGALAHMVYDAPHLRARVDTDVLLRREQLEAAEQVLAAHGWSRPPEMDFELAAAQRHYVKAASASRQLLLDVHWRIANPRTFSDALSFDELRIRAVPVPALGRAARAPRAVDAVFLACVHRVAHHDDEVDLLWLWDIHLLVSRFSAEDEEEFVSLAVRVHMMAVCVRGIDLVATAFATPGAAALASRLRAAGAGRPEPASRFLDGARPIATLRADLAAVPDWRMSLRLLGERLTPSPDYMRTRYPRWPRALLWLAYVDRLVRGFPRWFRRSRPRDGGPPTP
jgi:hypothetical protein